VKKIKKFPTLFNAGRATKSSSESRLPADADRAHDGTHAQNGHATTFRERFLK
jgi:hypothetical protein